MKDSVVSGEILEPYAQALMSLAQAHSLTDEFGENVKTLIALLEDSPDLDQFLANPFVKADGKKAVLQQVVGDQIHPFVKNFLMLLVDRRRISFLKGICQEYLALLRKLKQTVLAEVVSAVGLNDNQQQIVREKVMAITGAREVELEAKIDPDLIGGVVIRVGSQVVDASLRGQLRRISLRLTSAT